jgi:Peptidase S46
MNASADEGMWLVNDPPRAKLKEKYAFDLTDAWLDRAMKASVRFNNGGSGGFVSPQGLIVTNHHIGADALQKLSKAGRDLLKDGFLASSRADELKCPDLELNVLQSIEDVTARVDSAVKPELPAAEAAAARRAVLAAIEKESLDKTGLRSDVVTLYQGGLYHLYRYKKYTDVRLVFAPESAAAAFGGDVDNFEFPRFGFDVCFFRAYENNEPAKVQHFFQWATKFPAEGDLVFVSGHPGTTNRLETVAKLIHRRDHSHPYALARLRAMEAALSQFSERGPDERRVAANDLHRLANARKATAGQYQGLLDTAIIQRKIDEEAPLMQKHAGEPNPWAQIADTQKKLIAIEREYQFLERGDGFYSELYPIARHLVRLPDELAKPNGERLREYRDSALESLKFQLFSPAPIDDRLERAKLTASLTFLAEQLGGTHPIVAKILKGQSPEARAAELVAKCKLFDVAERKKLFDGGSAAIKSSDDTMIQLAAILDADARAVRKRFESEVEEPERQAYAKIAKARFAAFGRSVAPDATFTLRLAFGTVQGYEADGQKIPFFTTFGGLFDRAEKQQHREPFIITDRWQIAQKKLNLSTPFDFVSTADTIGGNSGSPVLNRAGELVGINFDRNRHGLIRNFVYTDVQARHIAVHGQGVLEALTVVYNAKDLVKELREGKQ